MVLMERAYTNNLILTAIPLDILDVLLEKNFPFAGWDLGSWDHAGSQVPSDSMGVLAVAKGSEN